MAPKEMKLSIVIPVYNVAPYIEDCLQSVMDQSWQGDLECILVDDCGVDNSVQIIEHKLKSYHGPIDFRVVHHERNRGLSAARNTGIDAVTGNYIYFLDSDDEITPDCLEVLAKPLAIEDYDFVVGDYRIEGSIKPKAPLRLADGTVLRGMEVLHAYRKEEWYMLSVNKLYKVAFLNHYHLRFRDEIIHEDELWSFQIACLAQSMYAVRKESYIYKVREGSITVKKNHDRRCYCLNVIIQEMCLFAKEHHLLSNHDVHNLIQNFRMITLFSIYNDAFPMFRSFYEAQRKAVKIAWVDCFRKNGFDVRKQIRDLHQIMPPFLAVWYLRLMFQFL